jgi:hypothetical protein
MLMRREVLYLGGYIGVYLVFNESLAVVTVAKALQLLDEALQFGLVGTHFRRAVLLGGVEFRSNIPVHVFAYAWTLLAEFADVHCLMDLDAVFHASVDLRIGGILNRNSTVTITDRPPLVGCWLVWVLVSD